MEELKKRYKLQDYKILSVNLSKKHSRPLVFLICEKDKQTYMIKTPLERDNKISSENLFMEYNKLNKYYPGILNPVLLKPFALRTNYLFSPSVSRYMNNPFTRSRYAEKVLKWLVDFHSEQHKEGIGHIHGDLSLYDVIIQSGKVIVFDWENYSTCEEQLIDVFYMIYKDTFSVCVFGIKDADISKFVDSLVGDKLHPFLKKYISLRGIPYTKDRRIIAFKKFISFRIAREEKTFSIPTKDHYLYKKIEAYFNIGLKNK